MSIIYPVILFSVFVGFIAGMFLGEHSYKSYLYAKGSSSYYNLVKLKDRRFIITEFKSVDKSS